MEANFSYFDKEIGKKISFREVDFKRDLHRIHAYMNEEHVIPFWQLDFPLEEFKRHLKNAINDSHQTLYIGHIDGDPMSYWEVYWVKDDIIGNYYSYGANDQGVHLLIGKTDYLGKGLSLPLLRAMVKFQFQCLKTEKVVAEPDIRNKKMIHVFEKCGFEPIKSVELPDKTGLLMICNRDVFERKWKNVGYSASK